MDHLAWVGIAFCITQSAFFSGLNLALFSIPRLRLEIAAAQGNRQAAKVLSLRGDSNYLLATILWGNVGINVLLALLSDSMMIGIMAFLFSTFVITFFGEIIPQAYFSRHALQTASFFSPLLRIYQFLLFPVAKPCGMMLDAWLGKEGIHFWRERELTELIRHHMLSQDSDVGEVEGEGALNFLIIDDLPLAGEGQVLDERSILELPVVSGHVDFPDFEHSPDDPFVQQLLASGERWVVFVDKSSRPVEVMDTDAFLRFGVIQRQDTNPAAYCFQPKVIESNRALLGDVLWYLREKVRGEAASHVSSDLVLVWGKTRRIISGTDVLERLFRQSTAFGRIGT